MKGVKSMNIIQMLTKVNRTVGRNGGRIQFIVLHYVGAKSSARNNGKYFESINRQASAHYFVDEVDIVQVVEDNNTAWAVGSQTYKHATARNYNTLNIEMCCDTDAKGNLIVTDTVENRTIELVHAKMKEHNIPVSNVIRHFDVTGKLCPLTHVNVNQNRWNRFISQLQAPTVQQPVQPTKPNLTFKEYKVRVDIADLRIRTGAGTNFAQAKDNKGKLLYTGVGAFTIVEEKTGTGAKLWGRLKSGVGWISLDHAKKV